MDHRAQEVVLPWNLFDGECGEHIYIIDSDETQVVRFHKCQGEVAKRVVACVNACSGLSTEELLTSNFGEDSVEVGTLLGQTMQQRDDLLAALKSLYEYRNVILAKGGAAGHRQTTSGEWVCDPWTEAFKTAGIAIAAVTGAVLSDSDGGHCD